MKCLTIDNYNDFECTGSQCPSTCCIGWSVIVDAASARLYEAVPGQFGDKLRSNLIHTDNLCYIKMSDNRCPFLTEENLCDIYRNLGKDKMCSTCTYYPRFQEFWGDIVFRGLNLSCPEVAYTLFQRTDSIAFDFGEIPDSSVSQVTNPETEDWSFFNVCIRALTTSTTLLQNRTFSLRSRLQLFLLLARQLQTAIDNRQDTACILDVFSNPVNFNALTEELHQNTSYNVSAVITWLAHLYNNLSAFKTHNYLEPYFSAFASYVNERGGSLDVDELKLLFISPDIEKQQIPQEHYCIYFLFRHFMKCYKERNIYKYAALILYLYCLESCLESFLAASHSSPLSIEERALVAVSIAKHFEHSAENNMDTLYQLFDDADMANMDFIMELLMV